MQHGPSFWSLLLQGCRDCLTCCASGMPSCDQRSSMHSGTHWWRSTWSRPPGLPMEATGAGLAWSLCRQDTLSRSEGAVLQ